MTRLITKLLRVSRRRRARLHARRARQRGMALILVLGALTILTVMLTEFQDETSAEFGAALSERDGLKAEFAAKSAVNLARLLIAAEPTIRKSIAPILMMINRGQAPAQLPVWEFAPQILGAFNDKESSSDFTSIASVNLADGRNLGMEGAGFRVKIVDEDSKVNVNTAARASAFANVQLGGQLMGLMLGPQYDNLFKSKDARGNFADRSAICSAIIDWTDLDTDTFVCQNPLGTTASTSSQSSAAEDSYYELLPQPYSRKNAAYDSLEELHLVRGVSDDFWATFVDPDPDKPEKRLVTVWGQGKINVNTANARTILALICSPEIGGLQSPVCKDPTETGKFLTLVGMVRGMVAGAPIFGSPRGFVRAMQGKGSLFGPVLQALQLKPVIFQSEDVAIKSIATESQVFSIYATGYVKAGKRETRMRVHAVVDFRGAPPPGMEKAGMISNLQGGGLLGAAGAAGLGTQNPATQATTGVPTNNINGQPNLANLPPGATTDALAGALAPSAAGNVVYFRLD